MKTPIYLLLATLLLASCQSQAEIDGNIESTPKWTLSKDLTSKDHNITTKILTNPSGQQFLIIRGGSGGIAIIPYKDNSPFTQENK